MSVPLTEGKDEDKSRQEEEHDEQVQDGEPPILCCRLSELLGKRDREPHEWDRVEEQNSKDVEEEMDQSNLENRKNLVMASARQD